jgi:hypothetical protein
MPLRLLGDQQRQGDGIIRAAEVVAAIAEEKQRDGEQVPAGEARSGFIHFGLSPAAILRSISFRIGSVWATVSAV